MGAKGQARSTTGKSPAVGLFLFCEVTKLEYKQEYIALLKRALASETETVRLYMAVLTVAPVKHIDRVLEIMTDETDHQAGVADLLLEAVAGESAGQEHLVPGVE